MYEISRDGMTLQSLSLFVGTGECNGRCKHCGGAPLRKYAPKEDGIIDEELFYKTIKACHEQGARYLSLSGSGEPTLSPLAVTKTLQLLKRCKEGGLGYSPINLYSNGIRIGKDRGFSDSYLPFWRRLGLTTVYVTVHDIDENRNAKVYGIESYPPLETVLSRIHGAGLSFRANIVLSKRAIHTLEEFVSTTVQLNDMGADCISAWPIRNSEDKIDPKLSPSQKEMDKIEKWVESQDKAMGLRLLREKSKEAYHTGKKLTLFPDGTLSNTWCNN